MAEAIGLASSIIALEGAVVAVWQLYRWTLRTAKGVAGAQKELKGFAAKIRAYHSVIQSTHFFLLTQVKDKDVLSPLLTFMEEHQTVAGLNVLAIQLEERIQGFKPHLESIRGKKTLVNKLKWWLFLQTSDFHALVPEMGFVSSNMSLVLQLIQLDILSSRDESAEHREQIKMLKAQIRDQTRQIKTLKNEMARQSLSLRPQDDPFTNLGFQIEEDLTGLCKSMIKNVKVTRQAASSTPWRSTANSASTFSPRRTDNRSVSSSTRNTPQADSTSRRLRRARSPLQTRLQKTTTTASTNNERGQHNYDSRSTSRHDDEVISPPTKSVSQPRSRSSSVLSREKSAVRPSSTDQLPTPPPEEDYTAVQSIQIHNQVSLDSPTSSQIIPGFLDTPLGRRPIDARLNPSLSDNIVSASFLRRLGFDMALLQELDEDVRIDIGDGRTSRSFVMIPLKWCQGHSPRRRPFEFWCYVYQDGVEGLTLGNNFIVKRRAKWPEWVQDDGSSGEGR